MRVNVDHLAIVAGDLDLGVEDLGEEHLAPLPCFLEVVEVVIEDGAGLREHGALFAQRYHPRSGEAHRVLDAVLQRAALGLGDAQAMLDVFDGVGRGPGVKEVPLQHDARLQIAIDEDARDAAGVGAGQRRVVAELQEPDGVDLRPIAALRCPLL